MSTEFLQALVNALTLGSLYAMVGVGFVILYKATGVLNFAQGALMVLGALFFYSLVVSWGVPWILALAISVVGTGVVGAVIYLLLFRRLTGAEEFTLVIATLGLSVLLITLTLFIWGPAIQSLPILLSRKPVAGIGGFQLSALDLFAIGLAVVVVGAIEMLLRYTRLGVRMRAVAEDPLLASLQRVSVHMVAATGWAIAGACAAAAGVVYAMRLTVDPVGIDAVGLLAFPAVLLGGLDSIKGVLVGGVLLALAQSLAALYIGSIWSDVTAFAVMLLVLLVRPNGLFGSRQVVRV